MNEPKHKGTEFSNVNRVWQQNEEAKAKGEEIQHTGNEFSNIGDVWAQNEREKEGQDAREGVNSERDARSNDFWDRVADDVASGYKNKDEEEPSSGDSEMPERHKRRNKGK